MDNNKIVDNLNFIKISFRIFIYKITFLKKKKKKPELSRKEIKKKKNHRQRMKTRLGARTGQKTREEKSKRHPNTKERSVSKSQFCTFGVPNDTLKGPNFLLLGFGPMAFG